MFESKSPNGISGSLSRAARSAVIGVMRVIRSRRTVIGEGSFFGSGAPSVKMSSR